ncbi:CASP-like protein 1B1 [Hibiscus syriacus]|uniref:CASP-like protein n=1 Tax=Hibiscus syriacus TaxID=106335 RepID=A0A6A3D597_HIBSY|nr:CASP-like protein 1B2 [Hibiscus syriacus]KAE8735714.1 CASP-like protein 1B1 [Hibiscus syriacus]
MAVQSGEKLPMFIWSNPRNRWTLLVLRLLAFLAAAAATLVMVLNKQTKTFVVATIGTTPLKLTLTAKFNHTPAFVFFVMANGLVSIHNLVMIMVDLLRSKLDYKGFRFPMVAILDMLNVALLSGGANAAVFMAELGKNGNSHARWDKICDKFGTYCDRGAGALIASFLALAFMLLVSFISILKLANSSSHISHNNN